MQALLQRGRPGMHVKTHAVEVLVVDDHAMVRRALRAALEDDGEIAVVGEAATAREAVQESLRLRPQVVVMDLRLPDGTGIEACRAIRADAPEVQVLILTSYEDQQARREAVAAGAAGYLLKDLDLSWLRGAILDLRLPPRDQPPPVQPAI